MDGFSTTIERGILDHIFRGNALAQPSGIYLALFNGDPEGAGTELADSGYARKDAADGGTIDSGWTAPAASGDYEQITNAKEIQFNAMSDAGPFDLDYFAAYDAATGGTLLASGRLRDSTGTIVTKKYYRDDVPVLAVGAVTIRAKGTT